MGDRDRTLGDRNLGDQTLAHTRGSKPPPPMARPGTADLVGGAERREIADPLGERGRGESDGGAGTSRGGGGYEGVGLGLYLDGSRITGIAQVMCC